ncbi:hypothetical protein QWY93_02670 [Echinicola jeungdonensis]|uniref:hypothetical protein n=1 Tax=Echinicola jeungdonensis TaxID=709343 RepID=UPI0025B468CF|nr:hypothetical protein [Echinicola jeungdonensis]MDN3668233.1 hypothetical protein [Echinicola jeungdonensis]
MIPTTLSCLQDPEETGQQFRARMTMAHLPVLLKEFLVSFQHYWTPLDCCPGAFDQGAFQFPAPAIGHISFPVIITPGMYHRFKANITVELPEIPELFDVADFSEQLDGDQGAGTRYAPKQFLPDFVLELSLGLSNLYGYFIKMCQVIIVLLQ